MTGRVRSYDQTVAKLVTVRCGRERDRQRIACATKVFPTPVRRGSLIRRHRTSAGRTGRAESQHRLGLTVKSEVLEGV